MAEFRAAVRHGAQVCAAVRRRTPQRTMAHWQRGVKLEHSA